MLIIDKTKNIARSNNPDILIWMKQQVKLNEKKNEIHDKDKQFSSHRKILGKMRSISSLDKLNEN